MKQSKMTELKKQDWDLVIKPRTDWLDIQFGELYRYRDLVYMFVKRDFVTFYKQTILGPLWYIIQPLVNTIVFTVIFGKLAKISTDGIPPFLFYLSGTVAWGYFATCLQTTSNIFAQNVDIFGKVYFPRLVMPFLSAPSSCIISPIISSSSFLVALLALPICTL